MGGPCCYFGTMPRILFDLYDSMGIKWMVPNRYRDMFSLVQKLNDVIKVFLDNINWYQNELICVNRTTFTIYIHLLNMKRLKHFYHRQRLLNCTMMITKMICLLTLFSLFGMPAV